MLKEGLARILVDLNWSMQYRKKRRRQRQSIGKNLSLRPWASPVFDAVDGNTVLFHSESAKMKIAILEKDIVRVTLLPDGKPRLEKTWSVIGRGNVPAEGRNRDDLSAFSLPLFEFKKDDGSFTADTGSISLSVSADDFSITWMSGGRVFAEDLKGSAYSTGSASPLIRHSMILGCSHYFGFGEKTGPLNRKGRRMVMMDLDVMGYNARTEDPLYKHIPFYIGYDAESSTAYGIFYDNFSICEFDAGKSRSDRMVYTADNGDIDYYMIYGPTIKDVVSKFSFLTGTMILPPKWTLGYLGSTMTYTERPDAQEQLKRFADLCSEYRIPCDLFHLSSGYTSGADGKRYVFEWNRSKVPDPAKMVKTFHDAGIKITANIKPAMLTTHPRYGEVAQFCGFIKNADCSPHVTPFWGGVGSYIDFTNMKSREWWKRNIKEQLLSFGIDSTWNDNNEFEIWDEHCSCDNFGRTTSIAQLRPLQTCLMVQSSFEAQTEAAPGMRPYLITRSGCAGIQRYAQTWTGDNFTSWSALKYNIPMGLSLSLSNIQNIGHDVGGFFGFKPSPELFIRWVQNGVMHPRFTIHSWHIDKTVNEPWMFPEALPSVRKAILFRYSLIPYIYSLMFKAHMTGEPLIRPMVFDFPGDLACADESYDYMFGSHLLCATVYEKGARKRKVYLPSGNEWLDYHTGNRYEGGQTVTVDAPLDRIPLLVKAGGIIVTAGEHSDTKPERREILLYPHEKKGESEFHLIEDDGVSLEYKNGVYADISIAMKSDEKAVNVAIDKKGTFTLSYNSVTFVLPCHEERALIVNGKKIHAEKDSVGRRYASVSLESIWNG